MLLGGEGDIKSAEEVDDARARARSRGQTMSAHENVLYKVSDESGELKVTKVAAGALDVSMLSSDDVMMVDFHTEISLWVGNGADTAERRSCYRIAMDFLKANQRSEHTPISVFKEGQKIRDTKWVDAFEKGLHGDEEAQAAA